MKGALARVCAAFVVAAGGLPAMAVLIAHASSTCASGSGVALDPTRSASDLTATPSPAWSWAGVVQLCAGPDPTFFPPAGDPQTQCSINLANRIPVFPDTVTGAWGETLSCCVDFSGPIAATPLQIGFDHRGRPVFDGPYPPEDGYKWCTWASIQFGVDNLNNPTFQTTDYGVGIHDPDGTFTSYDYPSLRTTSGLPTMLSPIGLVSGSSAVTLFLPDTLIYSVDPPAPPLKGVLRNWYEPMVDSSPGSVVTNAVAVTMPSLVPSVTLPFAICVNASPPTIVCNGNQFLGPIHGVAGIGRISGWAPGTISCDPTVDGFADPATCAASGTGGFANAVDLGVVPLISPAQAATTPCVDTSDWPSSPDCATLTGTWTYYPCQSTNTPGGQDVGDLYAVLSAAPVPCGVGPDALSWQYASAYGRDWPGEFTAPRVSAPAGGSFTLGPTYLPDGLNFVN